MLSKCTLNGTFVQTLHWISKHRAVPFLISCSLMWKCNSAREIVNYGRHSTPVGNLWKLFRNSKLFWLTAHSDRAYMESVGHYYFWCDHWPWSGSLCGVGPILSLVFQGKSKKWRIQRLHYPLRAGAAGVFFFFSFYQNAALITGLRFMSRSSDMITLATWPSIHISFCLTIHLSPLRLHLFSLHTFTLTPSSPICSLPCVSYLFYPPPHPLPPPSSSSIFFPLLPLLPLRHPFTSPPEPSEKPLELAAPEFWSATLWSEKACKTAFPINQ